MAEIRIGALPATRAYGDATGCLSIAGHISGRLADEWAAGQSRFLAQLKCSACRG
jgi:hypothetical protein